MLIKNHRRPKYLLIKFYKSIKLPVRSLVGLERGEIRLQAAEICLRARASRTAASAQRCHAPALGALAES